MWSGVVHPSAAVPPMDNELSVSRDGSEPASALDWSNEKNQVKAIYSPVPLVQYRIRVPLTYP